MKPVPVAERSKAVVFNLRPAGWKNAARRRIIPYKFNDQQIYVATLRFFSVVTLRPASILLKGKMALIEKEVEDHWSTA